MKIATLCLLVVLVGVVACRSTWKDHRGKPFADNKHVAKKDEDKDAKGKWGKGKGGKGGDGADKKKKMDQFRKIASVFQGQLEHEISDALDQTGQMIKKCFEEMMADRISIDDLKELMKDKVMENDVVQLIVGNNGTDIFNPEHRRAVQVLLIFNAFIDSEVIKELVQGVEYTISWRDAKKVLGHMRYEMDKRTEELGDEGLKQLIEVFFHHIFGVDGDDRSGDGPSGDRSGDGPSGDRSADFIGESDDEPVKPVISKDELMKVLQPWGKIFSDETNGKKMDEVAKKKKKWGKRKKVDRIKKLVAIMERHLEVEIRQSMSRVVKILGGIFKKLGNESTLGNVTRHLHQILKKMDLLGDVPEMRPDVLNPQHRRVMQMMMISHRIYLSVKGDYDEKVTMGDVKEAIADFHEEVAARFETWREEEMRQMVMNFCVYVILGYKGRDGSGSGSGSGDWGSGSGDWGSGSGRGGSGSGDWGSGSGDWGSGSGRGGSGSGDWGSGSGDWGSGSGRGGSGSGDWGSGSGYGSGSGGYAKKDSLNYRSVLDQLDEIENAINDIKYKAEHNKGNHPIKFDVGKMKKVSIKKNRGGESVL